MLCVTAFGYAPCKDCAGSLRRNVAMENASNVIYWLNNSNTHPFIFYRCVPIGVADGGAGHTMRGPIVTHRH